MRALVFLIGTITISAQAQTGPGGVGDNTGTSTLSAWYDANQGVTTSGVAVTQWDDQSGNGNDATPPLASNQPTLTATAVNTFPVLTFDGTTDYLTAPDDASLDFTTWSIFIVGQITTNKNYNAVLVKGSDSNENYEFLTNFPSTANIHYPVRYASGAGRSTDSDADDTFSNSAYGIYQLDYDQVNFNLFIDGSNTETDAETRTPLTNSSELYICNEQGTSGRNFSGTIAEIIMFSAPVNTAQQYIINNMLAAKYNISLAANDIYNEDDNGNYDYDVAGIGQASDGTNQTDSRGTGIVRISNASGLGNNEFLIWGHDNAALAATETSDVPSGVDARFERVWRVSERNETNSSGVNVGNIDMSFDLTGLGAVTVSDLRLLIDTDNDGIFSDETPISGATDEGSNTYQFSSVSGGSTGIRNNRRFTLGTTNSTQTPLPIELLEFTARTVSPEAVLVNWKTATETNNDFFTVERSIDGRVWEGQTMVEGAGNSSEALSYAWTDQSPIFGTSFYRLKQTDFDGEFSYSHIEVVTLQSTASLRVYPNPTAGEVRVLGKLSNQEQVVIYNILGEDVTPLTASRLISDGERIIDLSRLTSGVYLLHTSRGLVRVTKQ